MLLVKKCWLLKKYNERENWFDITHCVFLFRMRNSELACQPNKTYKRLPNLDQTTKMRGMVKH